MAFDLQAYIKKAIEDSTVAPEGTDQEKAEFLTQNFISPEAKQALRHAIDSAVYDQRYNRQLDEKSQRQLARELVLQAKFKPTNNNGELDEEIAKQSLVHIENKLDNDYAGLKRDTIAREDKITYSNADQANEYLSELLKNGYVNEKPDIVANVSQDLSNTFSAHFGPNALAISATQIRNAANEYYNAVAAGEAISEDFLWKRIHREPEVAQAAKIPAADITTSQAQAEPSATQARPEAVAEEPVVSADAAQEQAPEVKQPRFKEPLISPVQGKWPRKTDHDAVILATAEQAEGYITDILENFRLSYPAVIVEQAVGDTPEAKQADANIKYKAVYDRLNDDKLFAAITKEMTDKVSEHFEQNRGSITVDGLIVTGLNFYDHVVYHGGKLQDNKLSESLRSAATILKSYDKPKDAQPEGAGAGVNGNASSEQASDDKKKECIDTSRGTKDKGSIQLRLVTGTVGAVAGTLLFTSGRGKKDEGGVQVKKPHRLRQAFGVVLSTVGVALAAVNGISLVEGLYREHKGASR